MKNNVKAAFLNKLSISENGERCDEDIHPKVCCEGEKKV